MDTEKISESIKRKDLDRMRELPCCKQGMKFYEVFDMLVSYCEENKPDVEKWYKKKKIQK